MITGRASPLSISRARPNGFYRVDPARSRQTGGSGLGLAIVKHALSHHHARLEIYSELGLGTRFIFTLPNRLAVPADLSEKAAKN